MNEHIRRRALMATAKVALSFTVMGCGTVIVDDATPVQSEENEPKLLQPEPEDEAQAPLKYPIFAPEQLTCEAPELGQEITLSEELVACCSDELVPVLPTPEESWEEFEEFLAEYGEDADAKACCAVLIADSDAGFEVGEPIDWSAMQACCMLAEHPQGPTCTPWGPPVPPALWRRLDSLDALLADAMVAAAANADGYIPEVA